MPSPEEIIEKRFSAHKKTVDALWEKCRDDIVEISQIMVLSLQKENKILVCGNGGSAADAQHMSAELVGRFLREREGYTVMALGSNSAVMTSLSNDFGFEEVFARQVSALGKPGDLLISFSTSGNSENIIRAVRAAKENRLDTVGILGRDGGKLLDMVDQALVVPSDQTPRIQEMHGLINHILCEIVETRL